MERVCVRPSVDAWILSRAAGTAQVVEERLRDVDAVGATRALSSFIDDLSTWYLRLNRRRFSRPEGSADRVAAFATLHEALVATSRMLAPILPFLADSMYGNLVTTVDEAAPDSVHLTRWPAPELAGYRDERLESSVEIARRAVELIRGLRGQAGLKTRQPLARGWLALPADGDGRTLEAQGLVDLIRREGNLKDVTLIRDDSELVDRRVKVLLPKVGKRLGSAIPAVMAAAREGDVTFQDDGSVLIAGQTLTADEVEIQATPRPGTAVAEDDGLVMVLDTELTDALRAEGDARELARAIQELRRDAELELDDRIELWVEGLPASVASYLPPVAEDVLAELRDGDIPADARRAIVQLDAGAATIALRRLG
jgi:isoleucyl-tRNA synthetase